MKVKVHNLFLTLKLKSNPRISNNTGLLHLQNNFNSNSTMANINKYCYMYPILTSHYHALSYLNEVREGRLALLLDPMPYSSISQLTRSLASGQAASIQYGG